LGSEGLGIHFHNDAGITVNLLWDNIFRKPKKEDDIQTALKDNPLFRDLSARELSFVKDILHVRRYHNGELVFRQGEVGVGMYIIVTGRVEIFVTDPNAPEDDFREIYITQLATGDFFGELSLVEDGSRRTASAACREETVLIGFFKPDLIEILERNPSTGVKIVFRLAEILGRRLKDTTDKVSELRQSLKDLREQPPPVLGNGG
jgi:CRP/FNR family cyclic AMP-dependent transcriptional regulator